jgi:hypothetical protein
MGVDFDKFVRFRQANSDTSTTNEVSEELFSVPSAVFLTNLAEQDIYSPQPDIEGIGGIHVAVAGGIHSQYLHATWAKPHVTLFVDLNSYTIDNLLFSGCLMNSKKHGKKYLQSLSKLMSASPIVTPRLVDAQLDMDIPSNWLDVFAQIYSESKQIPTMNMPPYRFSSSKLLEMINVRKVMGFLDTKNHYNHLKMMWDEGRILGIDADISTKGLEVALDLAETSGEEISFISMSNAGDYLRPRQVGEFVSRVDYGVRRGLVREDAQVIYLQGLSKGALSGGNVEYNTTISSISTYVEHLRKISRMK